MITEDFVSFEIAKLLREKGFNENCDRSYVGDDAQELSWSQGFNNSYYKEFYKDINVYSAPRISFAMKWLRERGFIITPIADFRFNILLYTNIIIKINGDPQQLASELYSTYEQACEAGIKYCLKNLI